VGLIVLSLNDKPTKRISVYLAANRQPTLQQCAGENGQKHNASNKMILKWTKRSQEWKPVWVSGNNRYIGAGFTIYDDGRLCVLIARQNYVKVPIDVVRRRIAHVTSSLRGDGFETRPRPYPYLRSWTWNHFESLKQNQVHPLSRNFDLFHDELTSAIQSWHSTAVLTLAHWLTSQTDKRN
jgi:hypothetical protein